VKEHVVECAVLGRAGLCALTNFITVCVGEHHSIEDGGASNCRILEQEQNRSREVTEGFRLL
jgi:hypothetical protein